MIAAQVDGDYVLRHIAYRASPNPTLSPAMWDIIISKVSLLDSCNEGHRYNLSEGEEEKVRRYTHDHRCQTIELAKRSSVDGSKAFKNSRNTLWQHANLRTVTSKGGRT